MRFMRRGNDVKQNLFLLILEAVVLVVLTITALVFMFGVA